MIVDCAMYREGRRSEAPDDFSDALDEARATGDAFLWVGMYEPTEKEFEHVSQEFGLHPLAVEDALTAHQRPKMEVYDDSLFVVLKPVMYDDTSDTVSTGELMVFIGDSFVVTVRHGEGAALAAVRHRLEQDPEVLAQGPTAVLYAVSDSVVDHYIEVAAELQVDLEELEAEVFSPNPADSKNTAARIYGFKRQVRDVADHLTKANEYVEGLDRLLSDALAAHLAQMGVRQNDVMRKISAWAAMAAVPTMVAGIYGMNFEHMPELKQRWGYPLVVLVMVAMCLGLHRMFKRRGWL
ncbi:magnesium and cobalt transport protein CorA [Streptomyces sp. NPDC099050]|uniref:magnesium and cobalt transport protein CorA n=1 Tax=Streptomyces sp. NPDC099050 TaxID=3366100 RepID=UPI00382A4F69